jgi:hypothetical protein
VRADGLSSGKGKASITILVRPTLRERAREILPEQVGKPSPTSREGRATRVSMSNPGKETEEMYHYMQFDPALIREGNEQMCTEVSKLRLEKRLREYREPKSGNPFTFIIRRGLHLLRQERRLAA